MNATERIRAFALQLGFEAAGVSAAGPLEAEHHFEAWIAAGRHAGMGWMATERSRQRRGDVRRMMPGLKSVLCVALCYDPGHDAARDRRLGRIARYAAGEDYHRVMRDKLRALEEFVCNVAVPGAHSLWYVDTGAILERGWAERSGIGWIGKHAGLLSQRIGSWFLLGELLLDVALDPTPPVLERCGSCVSCIDVCPTDAIVAPYQVDARRCISYLTIEHRGAIPVELRPLIGDWVFGCDLCQEVCPWNRFAPPAREARLHARALEGWSLERFFELDDAAFQALFADSPIRRARREGLLRNVCVALGNRGEASSARVLIHALAREGSALVRGHAAWALGEIGRRAPAAAHVRDALARAATSDTDPEVRAEAEAALREIPVPKS